MQFHEEEQRLATLERATSKSSAAEKAKCLRSVLLDMQQKVGSMSSACTDLEDFSRSSLVRGSRRRAEREDLAVSHAQMMQEMSHLIHSDPGSKVAGRELVMNAKLLSAALLASGSSASPRSVPRQLEDLQHYVQLLQGGECSSWTEGAAFRTPDHYEQDVGVDSDEWNAFDDRGELVERLWWGDRDGLIDANRTGNSACSEENPLDMSFVRSSPSSNKRTQTCPNTWARAPLVEGANGLSWFSDQKLDMASQKCDVSSQANRRRTCDPFQSRPSLNPDAGRPLPCGVPVLFRPYEECQFPSLPQGSLMAMSGFGPGAKSDALIGAIVAGSAFASGYTPRKN